MGTPDATRKMVARVRTADHPIEVPVIDLRIEGRWRLTNEENPRQFMLLDNMDMVNRVILFCSPPCLELLSTSRRWDI